jgi:hypothetical protein
MQYYKVNLKEFKLHGFKKHGTVAPLLAYLQAVSNASVKSSKLIPASIEFSKKEALAKHAKALRYLLDNRDVTLADDSSVSILFIMYDGLILSL